MQNSEVYVATFFTGLLECALITLGASASAFPASIAIPYSLLWIHLLWYALLITLHCDQKCSWLQQKRHKSLVLLTIRGAIGASAVVVCTSLETVG